MPAIYHRTRFLMAHTLQLCLIPLSAAQRTCCRFNPAANDPKRKRQPSVDSAVSVSVGRPIPNHALRHYLTECTACPRVTHSSCERLRNQSITIFAAFVGF